MGAVSASSLAVLQGRATIEPAPLIAEPSEQFEGNDGPWSTFIVQVGTPAQGLRVNVAINGQETQVVQTGGCSGEGEPANCANLRGNLFNLNDSTSWVSTTTVWNNTGLYYLGDFVGALLGTYVPGEYGWDSVSLSWGSSVTVNHSIVGAYIATDYYVGQIGISPQSTNFTTSNDNSSALSDPQPSFLTLLREQNSIPSLSYSFTAGSYYRSQQQTNAWGSLILGGYDSSKLGSGELSFPFASDAGREFVVGIQGVTKSGTQQGLLTQPILAALDTTQPFIWLPTAVCQQFEQAFGLTWNDTAEMYFVNDTLHNYLVSENATVTFTLGQTTMSNPNIEIVLPYGSFDLTASYPIVESNSTRYFPLKRAANSTQYTLGRTFFQEAYLTADYERRNFSLSQVSWSNGDQNIIAIRSVNDTAGSGSGSDGLGGSSGLSGGAIAGIVVGIIAVLAIAAAAVFFTRRKKRRQQKKAAELANTEVQPQFADEKKLPPQLDGLEAPRHEADATDSQRFEIGAGADTPLMMEVDGEGTHRSELDSSGKPAELGGAQSSSQVYELPGDDVPEMHSPPPTHLGPQIKVSSPGGGTLR